MHDYNNKTFKIVSPPPCFTQPLVRFYRKFWTYRFQVNLVYDPMMFLILIHNFIDGLVDLSALVYLWWFSQGLSTIWSTMDHQATGVASSRWNLFAAVENLYLVVGKTETAELESIWNHLYPFLHGITPSSSPTIDAYAMWRSLVVSKISRFAMLLQLGNSVGVTLCATAGIL